MIRLAEEEASEIRARAEADAADRQAETGRPRRRARRGPPGLRGGAREGSRPAGPAGRGHHPRGHGRERAGPHRGQQPGRECRRRRPGRVAAARSARPPTTWSGPSSTPRQLDADATAERTRLDAESAARRKEIEEDFTIAITARRAQAHQYVAEQENESRLQAEELIANATAEAARIVAEADAEAQRRVPRPRRSRTAGSSRPTGPWTSWSTCARHVLAQFAGLRPFLEQIEEASARADELLQARADEAAKPGGGDFDPEIGSWTSGR